MIFPINHESFIDVRKRIIVFDKEQKRPIIPEFSRGFSLLKSFLFGQENDYRENKYRKSGYCELKIVIIKGLKKLFSCTHSQCPLASF